MRTATLALVFAPLASHAFAQDAAASKAPQADAPAAPKADASPRGLVARKPGAADGYALYAPIRHGATLLVDSAGEVVHEWKHGLPTLTNQLLDNGHLLLTSRIDDNPVFFGGGIAGHVQELDWDGKVVWDYVLSTEKQITHHDFELLPNGHVLVIVWEHHTRDEAAALGRDPSAVGDHGWWTDGILELEPVRPSGAKVVWEWHMSDHLVQDLDRAKPNYGALVDRAGRFDANGDLREQPPLSPDELAKQKERAKAMRDLGYSGGGDDDDGPVGKKSDKPKDAAADVPKDATKDAAKDGPKDGPKDGKGPPPDPRERAREDGDWTHTNSIDYDAAHDLLLLSSPHLSEIFVIDHSTTTQQARTDSGGRYGKGGEMLYRWGNPANWGAGATKDRELFGQHQPEWIRPGLPGAGHVLVFNNGSERPGVEHSSVDELVLPFDPAKGFAREAKQPFGPAAPAWSYSAKKKDEFYSFFISGCQRLANGNTFICSGQQGRLFEVTPQQEIVWEFWNPWGGELAASMGNAAPKPKTDRPSPVRPTSVFRATKLAPDHPGLKGRTLKPITKS